MAVDKEAICLSRVYSYYLSRSDLLMFVFITVTGLLLVVAVECHYIILEYLSGSLNRIEVASFGFNHFINRDVY